MCWAVSSREASVAEFLTAFVLRLWCIYRCQRIELEDLFPSSPRCASQAQLSFSSSPLPVDPSFNQSSLSPQREWQAFPPAGDQI